MRYILFFLLSLSIWACKQSSTETITDTAKIQPVSDTDLPDWAVDATIYEVNMRQFTEEGTFEAFSKHLPRIKDMGVDIIWLMPIHPISMTKAKPPLGSPYSVADYMGINPEYGNEDDFAAMVNKIHDLGMKIIIDWVPNHTGWDNPWITDHPEWYTQNEKGEIIDPIDYNTGESWGWTDVADLNYDNQEMRAEMIRILKFWINERNIDGYRMDVAHGVPDDFWIDCNAQLKAEGDIFLLAEGEVPKQRNKGGFHADYGWTLHHIMNEVAQGKQNVNDVWNYLEEDRNKFEKGFHMLFTSNHDENTWQGTVFERIGEAHKVMAVMAATFEGMPLVYGGQEEPIKKRLEFFEKDPIGFEDYAYQDFYTALLKLKKSNPALWNGKYGSDPVKLLDNEKVLAFERVKGDNKVTAILNLSGEEQTVAFDNMYNPKDAKIKSEEEIKINGSTLTMAPYSYLVFAD